MSVTFHGPPDRHDLCDAPAGYDVMIDGQSWLHGLLTVLSADRP